MFLFWSKLLPLFVYPLGLACVLMVVALVLLWRSPRGAAAAIATALIVLLVASNGWVAQQMTRSLEQQAIALEEAATGRPHGSELPEADAIVVLGGSTKPAEPPRPWVDLNDEGDRVLHAIRLYQTGRAPKILFSGGRITWKDGGPSESADMAAIARAMGVPDAAILEEPDSLNTRENAVNSIAIMEREGIESILLVTSAMHMPRSVAIFQKLGVDPIPAPTDFIIADRDLQDINSSAAAVILNVMPDVDRLQRTTRVLKEYLGRFIYGLRGWV